MTIETVWGEYQSSVKSFLHSKVSNPDDVDDLLQDILLKTYLHLNEVKDRTKVKSWLFQVANNAIIDFYRQKGRSNQIGHDDLWFEKEKEQVREDLLTCLLPFIQALPEEDAEMLTSIELHGQSQKAYAEEMGINYSTLKSRLKKSREKINSLFHECCELSLDKNGSVIDYEARQKGDVRCQ
ncbi:RNA polymerase sigma factor SigZ [Enterovibrio makurazakiensis]|uniref:RNA polymerase sigma factor SigZ n=1 Tax=Enterovibrio gelatinilyticus TaxID=2899819 RepID=A0ABT5QVN1_9GAMM|nr:RNA polymerase sigma factor SigZ [Enterovibrio sp. ZSDZ42]MDD1791789.1 RNA polymerase sigma factor SigZ [Enterovibrio sp. ZSDZ42]